MAYSEKLAERIRQALSGQPSVVEKKMFGGIAFMVHGKMCVTIGHNRIMCRVDPASIEEFLTHKGVEKVTMNLREYKGYIHVNEEAIKTKKQLDHWLTTALEYNKVLKKINKK